MSHIFIKGSFVFIRCAVLVTVMIVWIYGEILTAAAGGDAGSGTDVGPEHQDGDDAT
jgi:hypothetical protein